MAGRLQKLSFSNERKIPNQDIFLPVVGACEAKNRITVLLVPVFNFLNKTFH